MRNFSKKITASVLALFLALVSIFCCCLTGDAQAGIHYKAEQREVAGSRCCPDKTKNTDSENSQECKCEKTAEIIAIKGFDLSKVMNSWQELLDRTIPFFGKINVSDQAFSQHYILQTSIQIVKSDPPIYLQDSVFRL